MKIFNTIILCAGPAGAIAGYTPSETGLVHALPDLQSTGIVCQQHPSSDDHRPLAGMTLPIKQPYRD